MIRIWVAILLIALLGWEAVPFLAVRAEAQIVVIRKRSAAEGEGGANAAYDAVSNGRCCGNGQCTACTASDTTLTFSHTTGSGANRALDVFCGVSGPSATAQPAITSVTYAGSQSLTSVGSVGGNYKIEHWGRLAPTSGANNIVVVLASSLSTSNGELSCAAISTSDVDQSAPFTDSGDGASGTDTSAEWSMTTSNSGDLGLIAVCNGASVGTTTNGTVRYDQADATQTACATLGLATAVAGVTSGVWTVGNDSWLTLTAVRNGSN